MPENEIATTSNITCSYPGRGIIPFMIMAMIGIDRSHACRKIAGAEIRLSYLAAYKE